MPREPATASAAARSSSRVTAAASAAAAGGHQCNPDDGDAGPHGGQGPPPGQGGQDGHPGGGAGGEPGGGRRRQSAEHGRSRQLEGHEVERPHDPAGQAVEVGAQGGHPGQAEGDADGATEGPEHDAAHEHRPTQVARLAPDRAQQAELAQRAPGASGEGGGGHQPGLEQHQGGDAEGQRHGRVRPLFGRGPLLLHPRLDRVAGAGQPAVQGGRVGRPGVDEPGVVGRHAVEGAGADDDQQGPEGFLLHDRARDPEVERRFVERLVSLLLQPI